MRFARTLSFAASLFLIASCGQIETTSPQDNSAYIMSYNGTTAPHTVTGEGVNVRGDNLNVVLFTVNSGTRVNPTGRTKSGLGNQFVEIKLADGRRGWIAQQYISPVGNGGQPGSGRKIVVNLSNNRLTYFENGTARWSWNVITGKAGHPTPTGNYKVNIKQPCPPWTKPGTNETIAGCSAANPLGRYALWFKDGTMYGLHGTNQPELLNRPNPEDRRLSSGCIRNPNGSIEQLFNTVKVGDPISIGYFGN